MFGMGVYNRKGRYMVIHTPEAACNMGHNNMAAQYKDGNTEALHAGYMAQWKEGNKVWADRYRRESVLNNPYMAECRGTAEDPVPDRSDTFAERGMIDNSDHPH